MQNTTTAQAAATPVIERLPTFHTRRSPDMSRVCKRGPFLMRPVTWNPGQETQKMTG